MKAALSLTDKKYVAKPLRRVYIEKSGSKKKRIHSKRNGAD
jgi:RNA-directed DNA polymerase